jgi:hypothetical protein
MDVPADSPRRQREGIYDASVFGPPGQRVQVILLDTRYFRSNLATGENHAVPSGGKYIPHPDPNVTMLGAAQWAWLEEQLRVPAELRIHRVEASSSSPNSAAAKRGPTCRAKSSGCSTCCKKTRANGVLFISGDRHWAELSRLDAAWRLSALRFDLERTDRGAQTRHAHTEPFFATAPRITAITSDSSTSTGSDTVHPSCSNCSM